MPNRHPETGIAYGVVSLNSLQSWVFEEFMNHGKDLSFESAMEEFDSENPEADDDERQDYIDSLHIEEPDYELTRDGMKLGLSYLGGAPLVWVFESPHTAEVRQCSPCVPGAGDLDNPCEGGMVAYTLPKVWFAREE